MNYPQALRDHLGQTVTTVCRCWRLNRRDGLASGYTDHDMPVVVNGTVCEPQSGFSASEAKHSLGLQVDSVDIEGALSSASITDEDISAGLLDGANVETFLVNWRAPQHFARIGNSFVGKITRSDGRFMVELESRMRTLDQPKGRYVLRNCDAELGDARCGFALGAAFTGSGTVLSVQNRTAISVSGLGAFESGLFSNGLLSWTGGSLNGMEVRIGRHSKIGDAVILNLMGGSGLPHPGDTFSVVAGCDKSFATCRDRFSNALNFRGFPHLPGNDLAYSYASDRGSFDGGAIVP